VFILSSSDFPFNPVVRDSGLNKILLIAKILKIAETLL